VLTLEITTTTLCNFSCDYCFEYGTPTKEINIVEKRINEIIIAIKKILNSEWFKENFDKLVISFWGGEPTLKISVIKTLFDEFTKDKRVRYYIYTNGSNIDKLMPILDRCRKDQFEVQVSYDGIPLQSMRRKTKNGTPTTDLVLDGINKLFENDCDFSLKPTITWEDFKFLPEMWENYKDLNEKMKNKIHLSLTVDYHKIHFYKFRKMVEETLLIIAKKEMNFYKEHGEFLSNIFSGNKGICSAGKNFFIVDNYANLFTCHGAIYSDIFEPLGTIFDDDLLLNLENTSKAFSDAETIPKECENCVAVTCLRCNVKKAESSKKNSFFERWNDYISQPELCDYYKLTGRIGRAMASLLREEK
jgi:sulfatase maturation enzyme AslB (radical SAM superfamily)